jgi:hypothetical protein
VGSNTLIGIAVLLIRHGATRPAGTPMSRAGIVGASGGRPFPPVDAQPRSPHAPGYVTVMPISAAVPLLYVTSTS